MRIDARIRVYFLDALPEMGHADQLLLVSDDLDHRSGGWAAVLQLPDRPAAFQALAGHRAGCSCCSPRPVQAAILTEIFQSRARGETGFFRSAVAHLPPRQAESLREVLVSDPFVSGCFVEAS